MPARNRPIRIMLVDDSEAFLAAAEALVEHEPALVLAGTARNGEEALAEAERLEPDLVLIDAFMPVMDGLEATRKLKRRSHAPWVVVISLHDDEALRLESWAAGADGFVGKSRLAERLPGLARSLGRKARDSGDRKPPRAPRLPAPRGNSSVSERRAAGPGVLSEAIRRLEERSRLQMMVRFFSRTAETGETS